MKIYENKYIFIIDRISGACFAGITLMAVIITAIKNLSAGFISEVTISFIVYAFLIL